MPELPEVETMRRRLAGAVGRRIVDLRQPATRLRPIYIWPNTAELALRAIGCRLVAVERLGKRLVLELDSRDRLVIEPRMTGLVLASAPPDQEHLRLVVSLAGRPRYQIVFWDQRGLGVVRLVSPEQYECYYGPQRIGPDALEISVDLLRQRLCPSRQAIKVALLDQGRLAGIGNLYASEILHRTGIHPACCCNQLRPVQWKKLHTAIQEVLHEAIGQRGSTLGDGTYCLGREEPGGYQHCHQVYQRAGERCLRCGRADIVRIVQAQRSTFFCPRCQRRG